MSCRQFTIPTETICAHEQDMVWSHYMVNFSSNSHPGQWFADQVIASRTDFHTGIQLEQKLMTCVYGARSLFNLCAYFSWLFCWSVGQTWAVLANFTIVSRNVRQEPMESCSVESIRTVYRMIWTVLNISACNTYYKTLRIVHQDWSNSVPVLVSNLHGLKKNTTLHWNSPCSVPDTQ